MIISREGMILVSGNKFDLAKDILFITEGLKEHFNKKELHSIIDICFDDIPAKKVAEIEIDMEELRKQRRKEDG